MTKHVQRKWAKIGHKTIKEHCPRREHYSFTDDKEIFTWPIQQNWGRCYSEQLEDLYNNSITKRGKDPKEAMHYKAVAGILEGTRFPKSTNKSEMD